MNVLAETFEFEVTDPGYDFTVFFIIGIIVAIPLLFAAAGAVYNAARTTPRENLGSEFAFWGSMFAILLAVIGYATVAPIVGMSVYNKAVDSALYEAMEEEGFSLIRVDYSQELEIDTIRARYEGDWVVGTLDNLDYPGRIVYEVSVEKE